MCKVRFIVHVVSSAFDRNGNRSHFATLTSTKTGKSLAIKDLGGQSNMRYVLSKAMGRTFDINNPNVMTYESEDVPRRAFQMATKGASNALWEHDVTREVIENLEKEDERD